ncbi:hypothetical protein [Chitinophaga sp. Ak27]|uniref:hypothetical protein n=1 Tax=Chitinophaga sp. Ak27 TaxID=2726116 RepID=UPI00145D4FF5|nr:hypothetical protein [Chitinophaga sp. Ak27]NLU90629.1 hypothetical protein [Chitinophaga sp. Ak27]
MRHSYAREKFGVAVNTLATGTSDIRDRIWYAYLSFHTLTEKDFSEELKEDWLTIYNSLTTEEPTYDDKGEVTIGKVQNTLRKLDTKSCMDLAQKICDLNTKLRNDI